MQDFFNLILFKGFPFIHLDKFSFDYLHQQFTIISLLALFKVSLNFKRKDFALTFMCEYINFKEHAPTLPFHKQQHV